MRRLAIFAGLLVSAGALAAPDEEILGKSRGYPVCPLFPQPTREACLVGALSHYDRFSPTRVVAHGTPPCSPGRKALSPN